MKVLNIMLGRGLGGIEKSFVDYSKALTLQGCSVLNVTSIFAKINTVIAMEGKARPQQSEKYDKIMDCRVDSCKPPRNDNDNFKIPNLGPWDFLSSIYLKLIIYITKPDVVIAHGRRAIKLTKFCPLIGVAHNYNIKDLLTCDYIIALTNHMKGHLTSHNFPENKIEVIPNMIASLQRTNFKKSLCNDKIKIGTFGRFVKKKGFNIFLHALGFLKKNGYKFEAIIGGDGEEKNNLQLLCKELNLSNEVHFIGWVEDHKKFFDDIDIFCLPSLHEPFGIVILEAIAYGVPIISTKTEGPSEILEDKKTGIMVEVNSATGLSSGLEYLIENPDLVKEYVDAAYIKLQTYYSTNVVSNKLISFLNKFI